MHTFQRLLLNDRFILGVIIFNAAIIFLQGFQLEGAVISILSQTDNIITIIFLLELIFKMKAFGVKGYLSSNWNIFDAVLILLALPSLLVWVTNVESVQLEYLLVLRISRVFKFFRFLRFFPDIDQMIAGVQRALKASVIVLLGFFVFIFVTA
ncbi:ion transporter, partial [Marinilabilia sp.]